MLVSRRMFVANSKHFERRSIFLVATPWNSFPTNYFKSELEHFYFVSCTDLMAHRMTNFINIPFSSTHLHPIQSSSTLLSRDTTSGKRWKRRANSNPIFSIPTFVMSIISNHGWNDFERFRSLSTSIHTVFPSFTLVAWFQSSNPRATFYQTQFVSQKTSWRSNPCPKLQIRPPGNEYFAIQFSKEFQFSFWVSTTTHFRA